MRQTSNVNSTSLDDLCSRGDRYEGTTDSQVFIYRKPHLYA